MALLGEQKYFKNMSTTGTTPNYPNFRTSTIELDVSGTASSFELVCEAQVVSDGDFKEVAIVKESDYSIISKITETGFYKIDVSAFRRYRLKLKSVTGGTVTCLGMEVE